MRPEVALSDSRAEPGGRARNAVETAGCVGWLKAPRCANIGSDRTHRRPDQRHPRDERIEAEPGDHNSGRSAMIPAPDAHPAMHEPTLLHPREIWTVTPCARDIGPERIRMRALACLPCRRAATYVHDEHSA